VQTASSGLIALGRLTPPQLDLVTLIDGEATRLNKLCTRLLVAAKLDAEKVGLERANVNVQNLVFGLLAAHPVQGEKDRMQVVSEDPGLTVRVDRALLEMILAQYIDNARKYSTPNTPIEIATRKNRTEVLISVHNFGSTIRIEDLRPLLSVARSERFRTRNRYWTLCSQEGGGGSSWACVGRKR
jgi:K+-sensing histidine kinase KdpD